MSEGPFQHVLFATDFSAGAGIARDEAVRLARRWGSKLSIIHVLEDVAKLTKWAGGGDLTIERVREAMATSMVNETSYIEDLDVTTAIVEGDGKLDEEIEAYAKANGCDLLIIANKGERSLTTRMRGRSATRVMRSSSIPVMTVRPDAEPGFQHILCGVDFSDHAREALRIAVALARQSDEKRLTILHAYDIPSITSIRVMTDDLGGYPSIVADKERAALDAFLAEFDLEGLDLDKVCQFDSPSQAIIRLTKESDVDLICMGTAGRSGLRGFFFGNTAERVLHSTPCSIITTRAQ